MWHDRSWKRLVLEMLGLIALVLILVAALLGAILTDGLQVSISSAPTAAHPPLIAAAPADAAPAPAGLAHAAPALASVPG